METLQSLWDWFWAIRTNDPLTQFVAGNAILLALIWKVFVEIKKYKARLTPGTDDDAAVAKLEQIGNDIFRIVMPKAQEKPE
jgi:hypothetical protein